MADTGSYYFVDLDHRIILVATFSSFTTLFILSLLNRCNYVKHEEHIQTISNRTAPNATENLNSIKHTSPATEPHSASTISEICDHMITPDFYKHMKIKHYYSTPHYLNLIPESQNWPHTKIKLLIKNGTNYSESFHQTMLDNFSPSMIEPDSNPYLKDIMRAFKLFNEWRKWPVTANSDEGWKFKAVTKENMSVYSHSLADSPLDIVKADKVLMYSVPVVVGTLLNKSLLKKLSPAMQKMQILETPSESSSIAYIGVKCPPFITDRDFINLSMVYAFKDGSLLLGYTCVSDEEQLNERVTDRNTSYIRGTVNLSMYHIRPHYDGDIQHTRVTFYNHVLMNGFIPAMLLNANYLELVKPVQNLENHIKTVRNKLHKPGVLWIMPNPFLKLMDINVDSRELTM